MWKDYSADHMKNNRASGISIRAASFIAALFLSFLCGLFYNFWLDDIASTRLEDGDWHGRITGELSGDDLAVIGHYANVERAVINRELSEGQKVVVDIWFYRKSTIYRDMISLVNFERYQDVWDVMITVKNTKIEDFGRIGEICGLREGAEERENQVLTEIRSSTVYQKAEALCILPGEAVSGELLALGGLETVAGSAVSAAGSSYIIKARL